MCEWGLYKMLVVPIPKELSHTGKFRWAVKPVDICIAGIVQALNDAGIHTSQSCCGHGKEPGRIDLHDGRVLRIEDGEL